LLLDYALNLPKEAALVQEAVEKSLDEGFVTEDITSENAKTTSQVGDWIANYILNA